MKLLTTNFIKCSVKACDASVSSFPLKYDNQCEIELNYEEDESIIEKSYQFLVGILDKIDWNALLKVCADLGNNDLPPNKPVLTQDSLLSLNDNEKLILKQLFNLLINTEIVNGSMKCDSCGHVYMIKNGIPNLLLPPHLS
ncbi:related to Multifunctional methyltransferase subunit TRM112 [Hanseniaspora guilliermondii]|uniref:Related to Multifunctional methyltransferase subunit TRM112 n=1 Tax=Hanseniaspora guilliermondii TaxID=56406 RepID=A0A1L0B4U2_9ASCO|nr:related to Multifunctional methyltransferase subunit TRM112 [Hanseniaspora guilliermondii]